jgi:hypothetical protein
MRRSHDLGYIGVTGRQVSSTSVSIMVSGRLPFAPMTRDVDPRSLLAIIPEMPTFTPITRDVDPRVSASI